MPYTGLQKISDPIPGLDPKTLLWLGFKTSRNMLNSQMISLVATYQCDRDILCLFLYAIEPYLTLSDLMSLAAILPEHFNPTPWVHPTQALKAAIHRIHPTHILDVHCFKLGVCIPCQKSQK